MLMGFDDFWWNPPDIIKIHARYPVVMHASAAFFTFAKCATFLHCVCHWWPLTAGCCVLVALVTLYRVFSSDLVPWNDEYCILSADFCQYSSDSVNVPCILMILQCILMILHGFLMIFDDLLGDFIKNHQIPSTSHENLKNFRLSVRKNTISFQ